jgi:hypothetical protein
MIIKSAYAKVEMGKSGKIRMYWVEDERGRELFGPTENLQACEEFIKNS